MRKSMWILVVATGALALMAAGCGGGGKKSSAPPPTSTTTSTESTTTTTTTNTQATTTTQSNTGGNNFAASGKCKDLAAKYAQLQSAATGAKGNIQDVANALHQFAGEVPSEIKGDVETLADAISKYADALKAAGYTPGKTPTAAQITKIAAAAKSIQTAKVTQAGQHLSAWVQKNCT